MIVGSKISCIGVIGDGCGGGREFIIKDEILFAYDPQSGENTTLLKDVKNAQSISKKGCILSVICENESFRFDLSQMSRIEF